ncbi:unnamed protein product [Urochloa decumbens]|uniref:ARM repeat superfamily protein n=1 Tax=Urochloa decumbens TaxID=240449 RepID=A0ABC9GEM0_9POAL
MLAGNIIVIFGIMRENVRSFAHALRRRPAAATTWCMLPLLLWEGIIILPFQGMCYVIACLYGYSGPLVCIARRDYYGGSGDASSSGPGSNLAPALDMFYSLVLLQCGLYVLWASWYLSDTRARCWREPASIRGRTLRHFALDSLDSGSWEDMLSGVRFLDAFVMQGEDIRSQLLPFRLRIQRLIDALGWRQPADGASMRDMMREAAARILAHLAPDIHLAQFPGAMECISFLLLQEETTRTNEMILQCLAILEGLALDHHNCRAICSTPGLLRKIMAPLSSANLINDVSNNTEWARVVSGSFKVLYSLIQAPGKTSRRLRREIFSNKQSMSNLECILSHGAEASGLEELQMGAMEILTELALDPSINLAKETKEKLIMKQLQIFLADGEGVLKPLKEMAGRTLVLLSTNIESNSALIMTVQNDVSGRLTRILDANNTTTYRTIAAQILENLCAHSDLDKQWVKETLLPKVLTEILSRKRVAPENGVSPPRNNEENHNIMSTQQDDIEIQETSSTADQNKSSDGGSEEQTTTSKLMQEAFLSLALVIRDKLITAEDFDAAIKKEGLGPGAFVAKMKTMVEENCQETAESLRIVKLCGRIVEPMMQRDLYAQHFRNTEFVRSLSKASTIMSNLESCMLFAETDFGPRNTVRLTLSVLKNRALHLVIV